MKTVLLALLLLQTNAPRLKEAVQDFPRSTLRLKSTGPVSIDPNVDARTAYERIAEAAGLNILFDADIRWPATSAIRINNVGILEAFDMLSAQTSNFIEVLNEQTIIVSPDNQTKRREYELQVIQTFYPNNASRPEELAQIVTALRTLNARYIALNTAARAIVIRDTPDRIAVMKKTVAALDKSASDLRQSAPLAISATGKLFALQSPARAQLQLKVTNPTTFKMQKDSRTAFETIAEVAGLNVIFDRDFRSMDVRFSVDNVGILDALDLLGLQTRSFWTPLDSKTILVSPDNQTKRRDYDQQVLKTFYFANSSTKDLSEILTALRTLLNVRYVAMAPTSNAIVIRDTPNRIAAGEKIIMDLTTQTAGPIGTAEVPLGAESGGVLKGHATRTLTVALLQPKVSGPLSLDMNQGPRLSFEEIAGLAGLHVVFDNRFSDNSIARLKLRNVDPLDALDYLALQTGNLWEATDNQTIIVAPDNQTVRQNLERRIAKTIGVTNSNPARMTELITVLRTLLNLRQVDGATGSIVIEDTPANIALAETIIATLDRR